jgi:hypothetical protein
VLPIVKSHNKHAEIVKSTCGVAESVATYQQKLPTLPECHCKDTKDPEKVRVLESNDGTVSKVKHLKLLDLVSRIKIKDSM